MIAGVSRWLINSVVYRKFLREIEASREETLRAALVIYTGCPITTLCQFWQACKRFRTKISNFTIFQIEFVVCKNFKKIDFFSFCRRKKNITVSLMSMEPKYQYLQLPPSFQRETCSIRVAFRGLIFPQNAEIVRYRIERSHRVCIDMVAVATWEHFKWGNMPEPRMYRGERTIGGREWIWMTSRKWVPLFVYDGAQLGRKMN